MAKKQETLLDEMLQQRQQLMDAGGPAFPVHIRHGDGPSETFLGLTLRDHFAGQALMAMISKDNKDGKHCGKLGVDPLSNYAYEYADAMLTARKVAPRG